MHMTKTCYRRQVFILTATLLLFLTMFSMATAKIASVSPSPSLSSEETAVYIIQFKGEPLATYTGTIPGLAATNPRAAGTRKLDINSAAAQSYSAYLAQQRLSIMARIETAIGRTVKIIHTYNTAFNGVALRLSAAEAATIATLPDIVRVAKDREVKINSVDHSTALISGDGPTVPPALGSISAQSVDLFIPALLLCSTLLWALWQRKQSAYRLVVVSICLVVFTAACSDHGGHSDIHLESPDGVACSPGAAWIGAPGVWDGSSTGNFSATMGEGVVVGIIDMGINPHSPSFAAVGDDGYQHQNPRGKYYGVCDPDNTLLYNPNFPCNEKLIGAWNCVPDEYNAVDADGHGSHVAATAAGNIVNEAIVHLDSGFNISATISGVAPHANLISYKVADAELNINSSALLAAIEQAIKDGVDVINMSIGGGVSDPWQDAEQLLWLNVREAGIFVAIAAGNDGPEMATVGTPAIAPWLTAVGASTHDISYINSLIYNEADGTANELVGLGLTPGYGPATVVYAGDYGDALCQGTFNASFDGEIVICDRGENARVDKGKNVKANGGGGMILAEVDPGDSLALTADGHFLPAVHISQPDGDKLKAWLNVDGDHQATITGMSVLSDKKNADKLAAFSSRGWNRAVASIIKPDIVAPGASIIAPVIDGVGYAMYGGTSMASPHIAGVFALLKALHPDWSAAQAQSAIMTTAVTSISVDDEGTLATPFDAGSGRIDIGQSVQAALVLDESTAGYENSNPELYWNAESTDVGDPTTINLASLGDANCIDYCSWQRTLHNSSASTTQWQATVESDSDLLLTVTPARFTLASGESAELTVEADATALPIEDWAFGRVTLTETYGDAPSVTLPVAVRSMEARLPTFCEITTAQPSGSKQYSQLEVVNVSSLTTTIVGLKEATVVKGSIDSDPTPEDFANGDGGTYTLPIEIPADTLALVIELESTEAPDLDLYLGKEDNPEPVSISGNSDANEAILLMAPESGNWWIKVQNFASNRVADPFTLHYAIITTADIATGNLTATRAPLNASPFSLTLGWNLPDAEAGDHWYGMVQLGTLGGENDEIGSIPIKLVIE
ncbi:MAG: S8 family serine peptidase [Desulfuromonas sp.]|nr:S8 family serine peptidase [Desulfuromonas sp.]